MITRMDIERAMADVMQAGFLIGAKRWTDEPNLTGSYLELIKEIKLLGAIPRSELSPEATALQLQILESPVWNFESAVAQLEKLSKGGSLTDVDCISFRKFLALFQEYLKALRQSGRWG